MKRILTALALTAALTLSLCPAASAQESEQLPPGTEIGKVYATDIVTYLDGMPMPSYNIGGKTAILVRDLVPYGFEVEWDPDKSWAIVSSGSRPEQAPDYTPTASGTPGQVVGSIYSTEIVVFINGFPVPSFNLGGAMAVTLEDLCADQTFNYYGADMLRALGYSSTRFRVEWDPEARAARLSSLRIGDSIQLDGASYEVIDFWKGSTWTVNCYPAVYRDNQLVYNTNGGLCTQITGDSYYNYLYYNYLDTDMLCSWLAGYNCELRNGALYLTLPETVTDVYVYYNSDNWTPEQLAQYPDRLELNYALYVTRGYFGTPIVSVPVYIEQGGTVREIQARAAVPNGILRIDLQLLQMLGIQEVTF